MISLFIQEYTDAESLTLALVFSLLQSFLSFQFSTGCNFHPIYNQSGQKRLGNCGNILLTKEYFVKGLKDTCQSEAKQNPSYFNLTLSLFPSYFQKYERADSNY